MPSAELKAFLAKAKINTYAISGEGGERALDDGSKELVFKEGDFVYLDESKGNVSDFKGAEKILFKHRESTSLKEVYRLVYHGGFVKKSQL